jgi:hypothetical protein
MCPIVSECVLSAMIGIAVLCDVVKAMFAAPFVEKLFQPAEVYTDVSTREVFNSLAHSSIMRLNKSSMDKLYDLMTMGVKQQVCMCRCPEELVDMTKNHLRVVRSIATDPATQELLDSFDCKLDSTYGPVSSWQMWELRRTMMRFFQDRRVKVSIFLQDLQQNLDGTFVIDCDGPMAPGVDTPGTLRYLDADGKIASERTFPHAAEAASGASGTITLGKGTCPFGLNMYARDRRSRKETESDDGKPKPWPGPNSSTAVGNKLRGVPHELRGKGDAVAEAVAGARTSGSAGVPSSTSNSASVTAADSTVTAESARAGLALLSTLIGSGSGADAKETVRLSLFGDEDEEGGGGWNIGDEGDESGGVVVVDGGSGGAGSMAALMAKLGFDEDDGVANGSGGASSGGAGDGGTGGTEDEDDLLALLDDAADM